MKVLAAPLIFAALMLARSASAAAPEDIKSSIAAWEATNLGLGVASLVIGGGAIAASAFGPKEIRGLAINIAPVIEIGVALSVDAHDEYVNLAHVGRPIDFLPLRAHLKTHIAACSIELAAYGALAVASMALGLNVSSRDIRRWSKWAFMTFAIHMIRPGIGIATASSLIGTIDTHLSLLRLYGPTGGEPMNLTIGPITLSGTF